MKFKPRKSISSRYTQTSVNSKYFAGIDIASGDASVAIGTGTKKDGYIYLPYIILPTKGIYYEPTPEEVREERRKKLKRIYG